MVGSYAIAVVVVEICNFLVSSLSEISEVFDGTFVNSQVVNVALIRSGSTPCNSIRYHVRRQ